MDPVRRPPTRPARSMCQALAAAEVFPMPASRRGFLLGLGVLAAPTTLLAPALTPTAAEPRHDHDPATDSHAPAVAFERTMRALWEDHATWTRLFIVSVAADLPDQEVTAQ